MAARSKPPYRADHVGSLIRPDALRNARKAGNLPPRELRAIEDACIREVVALQERTGLQPVTDGEFRRITWRESFFKAVDGYSAEMVDPPFGFKLADGSIQKGQPVPRLVGKLKRRQPMVADDFAFLRSVTTRVPKVTLPAPAVVHFYLTDKLIDRSIYPDNRAYMADVSAIYREELAELAARGCTYVQLDDVSLAVLCDPAFRATLAGRGESAEENISLYIKALNDAVRGRPAGLSVCVHLCRGNTGQGIASGGYDPITERLFNEIEVDGFLLEYDTPRAGDFTPLRFVPKGKTVALGLVSTKLREPETVDALRVRVDEAARYLDIDQLCLCTQCGFASGFQYDRLTIEDEERKLERLVEATDRIWGNQ